MEKLDLQKKHKLIVEELQKGYTLKDKVLRYTKVKILKKRECKKSETKKNDQC